MYGYSIKEVLEDNSMDIYMIMEALDTQKIHWYLKRKEELLCYKKAGMLLR